MMSRDEWMSHVWSEIRAEERAGCSINDAVASAMSELAAGSWDLSMEAGIRCEVMLHDLLEVAARLVELHGQLKKKLPGVLDEMANL